MDLSVLLETEGLTTLRVGGGVVRLSRDFTDVDWSGFNREFETDSLPGRTPRVLDDAESRGLIKARGAGNALTRLERLMEAGRHQMMTMKVEARLGIRTALFVHSSRLGHNNGLHAIRAGGFRRHETNEPEAEVLADGLNLARAMSYKNAAAELPLGGCKMTVQCDPIALEDEARLGFLAFAIESGRFLTGPDMGFLPEHADVMRRRFTRHVTGGRDGVLGPTGTPTALGCYLAIQEAAEVALGGTLRGKVAAIQGLGAVGLPLLAHLAEAGMELIVADPDPAAIEKAKSIADVRVVPPEEILFVECDLLAPCAFGGILTEETVGKLSCKMIYGSANNPLAATSIEEELALAERLQERGILFTIEWTHNTAGVMSGYEEYARGVEATAEHLRPRLERVCREGTRALLEKATSTGKTPTRVAYEEMEKRIY